MHNNGIKMKLSIIVPVYNVEPYLRRCIDSILAQTFTDFELILVDDGSPDNCPAICDEYAEKDPRIVVIHKENGGLSDARNAGLDIAKGEYIGFVDSDDFIHKKTYELALDLALNNDAEIVQWCCVPFFHQSELDTDRMINAGSFSIRTEDTQQILDTYFPDYRYEISTCVWNKIYERHIFDSIRFPKGIVYEDSYIFLDTINAAHKLLYINEHLYYYFQRSDSIMHSNYSCQNFCSCLFTAKNVDFFNQKNIPVQRSYAANEYLERYAQNMLMVHFRYKQYKKDFAPYRRQYLGKLRYIIFNPTVCRMKKLMALMLVISPKIAYKICRKYFPECLFEPMR